jgi:ferredoxin
MTETPTIKDTVAKAERFAVDPHLCIACDACCQDFPEIFFMGQDAKAHTFDVHDSTLYNARTVVDVCPTAAISYTGETAAMAATTPSRRKKTSSASRCSSRPRCPRCATASATGSRA